MVVLVVVAAPKKQVQDDAIVFPRKKYNSAHQQLILRPLTS